MYIVSAFKNVFCKSFRLENRHKPLQVKTNLFSPYPYDMKANSPKATIMMGKSMPKSLNNCNKYSPILVQNASPGKNMDTDMITEII